MALLASPYARFDRPFESDFARRSYRIFLEETAAEVAKRRYKNVDVVVQAEDGSKILRVFLWGSLAVNLITAYGGFRTGIDYLVDDAKWFGDQILDHLELREGQEPSVHLRRLGTVGDISRLGREVDELAALLDERQGKFSYIQTDDVHSDVIRRLKSIRKRESEIIERLDPKDRELFYGQGFEVETPEEGRMRLPLAPRHIPLPFQDGPEFIDIPRSERPQKRPNVDDENDENGG
ncbi:hypothetical protein SAMN06265365_13646 [Tistlia consotensis]|uniref:Uncharacterized protein n=1 Tax=Tistlia consotensis USBA 355 TaxID=560819 RepID=A0A1Y6CP88_9PROT|nr:hypothetical protein [Tistlia consotensis]SMF78470.1 hypothetical protein SAMN05428998_13847 [Tistlia consotensis USBA 355]SNS18594.1 hypothetical protein SAMN06265365_13646 [Tistlia consotensis]